MPWFKPPPLLDEWRDFNQIQSKELLSMEGSDLVRYERAIHYELELMARFIQAHSSEQSLFILVGDHQPPGMEHLVYDITPDAATPVHIISKDSSLTQGFMTHGFQEGWLVDLEKVQYMRHEDFYSMFFSVLQN